MAAGDIQFLDQQWVLKAGTKKYLVQAGATAINPGEPVAKALETSYVTAAATSTPTIGTTYWVGIAIAAPPSAVVSGADNVASSQTATADGFISVASMQQGSIYLVNAKTPSTVFGTGGASNPSQATYNTFVGNRVTMDLTSSVYTINNTDSSGNGLVIEYVDQSKYPGKVAFSIRNGSNYLA